MAHLVLIVDDNQDLRNSLALILSPICEVAQCENGAKALAFIREKSPKLVLLDVSMPGMDGLQVLAQARVINPNLAVVMLTSHQNIDLARKALNLGAAEYVTKPFDAEYIRAEIGRLLNSRKPDDPEKPWRVVS